ncbi:MAG: dolichol kinase [Thermoplasmataceae archaeon]
MIGLTNIILISITAASIAGSLAYRFKLFWKKYAISIPLLILLYYFFPTILVFPVFVLSLISTTALYSMQFYLPFFADFAIIFYFFWVGGKTYSSSAIDVAVSLSVILVMMEDRRLRDHSHNNDVSRGKSKEKEVNRDYVQIGIGVIALFILLSFKFHDSSWIFTFSALLLYLLGNYFSNDGTTYLGNFLNSLERPSTPLGIGAMWLAAGLLLAVGIVGNVKVLALILFILMIGDSLATIIGSNIKSPKLPYNKRKSIAGLLADFLPAAIFGFIILGYWGVAFAAIGSIVESAARYPFDDNYMIPLVLAALSPLV